MLEKDYTHGGNIYKASKELGISEKRILDFSANINPLGMSIRGIIGIIKTLKSVLNYPDPEYLKLKRALSEYYGVKKEYLNLSNGAIQSIYTYVSLRERGKALIPAPGFVEYEKALLSSNWEVSFYNTRSEIDPKNVDSIFICNPNNPTGEAYSDEFLKKLLEKCKKHNTDLFIDEAFIEFSTYKSLSYLIEKYENLFILKSLTKFFAVPGLRLGGLLTSNREFLNRCKKSSVPWSINSVAENYIIQALKDKKYIGKTKSYIKRERLWLYRELSKLPFLKVFRTQGNYILIQNRLNFNLREELKKHCILIRSCSNYNNLDSSYYRVAVKKHRHNKKLINALSGFISK